MVHSLEEEEEEEMAVDLVVQQRDTSLGWGSLLMSFGSAGYVIFLPQRPVIDSAAGMG